MSTKKHRNLEQKDIIKEKKGPGTTEWVIYGIIAVFLFCCFIYWDILVTTSHTANYIESISAGKIFDLYKVNYNFPVQDASTTVSYDLPIYFIFMIWDFPIWLAQHFGKVNIITNFPCMLWMKGISVLFLGLNCMTIKKICQEIKIKESHIKWVILIFLSSPLVFSSIFILCQYDIIPIFFMLLGIYAYIRDDQKKFLMWFAIAIPMKLFPLFVFIPLLLLREKRILHIILKGASTLSILIVFRAIEWGMPYYKLSTQSFTDNMLDKLINSSTLNINFGASSLFVVAYVLLCVYCYMKRLKNKNELYKYTLYIPYAVFIIFFIFVNYYPYWLVYLTPFFPLLLFKNSKYFNINLLVETLYSFITLFIITTYFPWCFGAKQVNGMFISKFTGNKVLSNLRYESLSKMYFQLGLKNAHLSAFHGIFLALSICILVINAPKLNEKIKKIEIDRTSVILRMLLIMPFAILMVACFFT